MPSLGLPIYGQTQPERAQAPWRSLAGHEGRVDPAAGAYPHGDEPAPDSFGRRSFMQLLGASVALSGLAACKPPREPVVSYVKRPAGVTPSLPSYYATALSRHGYAVGLLVESHEGRPTKIEGLPGHPASRGGSGLFEQAAILDLYDPQRLAGVRRFGRPVSFGAFLGELDTLAAAHLADGGAGLRVLCEPTASPALKALHARLAGRFPRSRADQWDPVSEDAGREGAALAFGRPLEPDLEVARADVILSLDADFLAGEGDHLRHAREFASRRTQPEMNRLYVAESGYSVTGGVADHRLRMPSGEVIDFARAVVAALVERHGLAALSPLGAPSSGARARLAAAVAKDLFRVRGRGLVVAGRRQPAALHALAAVLNAALGNAGRTVVFREPSLLSPATGTGPLATLCAELAEGKVETLVITAWNPAYTAPADLNFPALLKKAKRVIYLAQREDETSALSDTVVASVHPLEAWGDARGRDGTVSIVQPLVSPLRESVTELELLGAFTGVGDRGAFRLVREPLTPAGADAAFDRRWDAWLSDGLVAGSALPAVSTVADVGRVAAALSVVPRPPAGLEVVFAPDEKVLDGRFAENAWLQELPHPVTKLTWDNAALLSPATARRLGLADGDRVALTLRGRTVEGAVLVQPGHADESVTLPLGYGRRAAGPVGTGVGFDAGRLRTSAAPFIDGGLEVKKLGGRHELAQTQEHFSMEGRFIAMTYPVERLAEAAETLDEHRGASTTILPAVDYSKEPYRWGMAIDLTKCIGCAACTVACQAENNIPVVGKEQVLRSREMHWIRVDRYYEGPPEDPTSVSQPLACVHCELAPCEYVCPVNATVHSDEGLNEMVYNRCVGTRYCSNNCPYKVRRFNYLDYRGTYAPTIKMLQNPDVTVRGRGVMEKCSYCVQRIERGRIGARVNGGTVGGDAIQSACQQACPAEAIVFGNLADPTSRVARLQQDPRRYDLLHELGTRPRTGYLVRLTNPNPELA
jgi:Fe-S-cluster-containing dehydrogenase component